MANRSGFTINMIHGYATVSFAEGEGSPSLYLAFLPSELSSGIHMLKQAILSKVAYPCQPMFVQDACCIEKLVSWVFIAVCK
jgi:hypothetical protein